MYYDPCERAPSCCREVKKPGKRQGKRRQDQLCSNCKRQRLVLEDPSPRVPAARGFAVVLSLSCSTEWQLGCLGGAGSLSPQRVTPKCPGVLTKQLLAILPWPVPALSSSPARLPAAAAKRQTRNNSPIYWGLGNDLHPHILQPCNPPQASI